MQVPKSATCQILTVREAKYCGGKRLNYTDRTLYVTPSQSKTRSKVLFRDAKIRVTLKERLGEPYLNGKH